MTDSSDTYQGPESPLWLGSIPGNDDRDSVVSLAIEADAKTASEIDLALTWRELTRGSATVVGSFFSATRCGVMLAATPQPDHNRISGRRLEIIESVLSGVGQNCVAIDMQLAPSTVALNARQALERLGVSGRPSRAHPLLMLAATAANRSMRVAGALSFIPSPEGELQVIGVRRPELRLADVLPSAELSVISKLLEGCSYTEIAASRKTAERTVANQIAAVFKRLNVSGRSELIQRLFTLDGLRSARPEPPTPPSTPPPTVRAIPFSLRTGNEALVTEIGGRRYAPLGLPDGSSLRAARSP